MKKIFIMTLCLLALFSGACNAQVKEITARGEYVMGDRDSKEIAKEKALKDAMRQATEQAGVLVTSVSETKNMVITKDEVKTLACHVIKVLYQSVEFKTKGEWVAEALIQAEVDTDDINQELLNEIRKLREPIIVEKVVEKPVIREKVVFKEKRRLPNRNQYTSIVLMAKHFYDSGFIPSNIKCVKAENGIIVYNHPVADYDFNEARLFAKPSVGSCPLIIKVVRYEPLSYNDSFSANPIVSMEDAEKMLEVKGLMRSGKVFLLANY